MEGSGAQNTQEAPQGDGKFLYAVCGNFTQMKKRLCLEKEIYGGDRLYSGRRRLPVAAGGDLPSVLEK